MIAAAVSSHVSTFRLAITTIAPREANSFAIALPIPVPPPDTKATLFAKRSLRKQLRQGVADDMVQQDESDVAMISLVLAGLSIIIEFFSRTSSSGLTGSQQAGTQLDKINRYNLKQTTIHLRRHNISS